ncbi:MAG: deoxyribonuclease V [Pirellulaceae bacterium]
MAKLKAQKMIACVDVQYDGNRARAACVVFDTWTAPKPQQELVCDIEDVADYIPGQFYLREMPCVQQVIAPLLGDLDLLIIDGYVYLDESNSPGLGAHLYEALDRQLPIVGVAKTSFKGSKHAAHVTRNGSSRPLYLTAIGTDLDEAADNAKTRRSTLPYVTASTKRLRVTSHDAALGRQPRKKSSERKANCSRDDHTQQKTASRISSRRLNFVHSI